MFIPRPLLVTPVWNSRNAHRFQHTSVNGYTFILFCHALQSVSSCFNVLVWNPRDPGRAQLGMTPRVANNRSALHLSCLNVILKLHLSKNTAPPAFCVFGPTAHYIRSNPRFCNARIRPPDSPICRNIPALPVVPGTTVPASRTHHRCRAVDVLLHNITMHTLSAMIPPHSLRLHRVGARISQTLTCTARVRHIHKKSRCKHIQIRWERIRDGTRPRTAAPPLA